MTVQNVSVPEPQFPEPEPENKITPEQPQAAEPEAQAPEAPPPTPEKIDEAPPPVDKISELEEKYKKLEARHFYLQRQFERVSPTTQDEPLQPETAPPANAPKEADFETFDAYQQALVDFRVSQALAKERAKAQDTQTLAAREQFKAQLVYDGRAKYADWTQVVETPTLPITNTVIDIARQCDDPAAVMYYLGRNPVECATISRMTPVMAARAIGRIESQLTAQPAQPAAQSPPKKTISHAPPPIKPVGSASIITKDPNKMSQAEYEEWRRTGGGRG
jgi:hypothetical protein